MEDLFLRFKRGTNNCLQSGSSRLVWLYSQDIAPFCERKISSEQDDRAGNKQLSVVILYNSTNIRELEKLVKSTLPGGQDRSILHDPHARPNPRLECKPFAWLDRRLSPAENPFSILGRHINTAMAMRGPKVIMPVSPMQSNPTVGDIGIPWHAWQIENGELIRPAEHMVSRAFVEGMEQPDRALKIFPSRGYPR